jgi:hypothetical protein
MRLLLPLVWIALVALPAWSHPGPGSRHPCGRRGRVKPSVNRHSPSRISRTCKARLEATLVSRSSSLVKGAFFLPLQDPPGILLL